jgi:hypothetical protein
MATGVRIPGLTYKGAIPTNAEIPYYLPADDTTYRMNASDIMASAASPDDAWNENTVYNDGDISTYGGEVWISNENDNTGNPPGPTSTHWTIGVHAAAGEAYWSPGVYTGDAPIVIKEKPAGVFGQYLLVAPRPFNSVDFDTELAAGKWKPLAPPAGAGAFETYDFDSDLFTEQSILFSGPIDTLSVVKSDAINSLSYQAGLDGDPTVYDDNADLTALQTWIDANVTAGVLFWIKVLINYKAGRTEQSQVILSYKAAA